jgi:hypothetical protein
MRPGESEWKRSLPESLPVGSAAMTSTELLTIDPPNAASTPFDYSALAPYLAEDMRNRAGRIHNIQQASVLELGRELIAAKELVDHGFFRNWVKTACQMGIRNAERAMQAALFVEKNDKLSYLPPDGLLTLASRSAPEAVVNEIIGEISAGERPSAAQIKRRISQAKQAKKRASLREGDPREVQHCQHSQVEAATNELIAMLVDWDRFDEFTALLKKADLSSFVQALSDRPDRLASASVTEGELMVTCPQQRSAEAPGETPTDSTVEAAAEAIRVQSPEVVAEITSHDGNEASVEASSPVLPEAAGETVTDDCIEAPAEAASVAVTEGVAEISTEYRVEEAAEAASLGVRPERPNVHAEELFAIWSPLKPNTRWYGREWMAAGCPSTGWHDGHHTMTENLQEFRAAALRVSPAERQRFLDITAPPAAGRVEEAA